MYIIKYRKPDQWLFRSLKLKRHYYAAELDKMIFTFEDDSVYELASASKVDMRLPKETMDYMTKRAAKHGNDADAQSQDHK